MLAGAAGIDLVLFVVAADESIKPQTREHFEICRMLGVQAGVIALTKADLADPDMLDLVRLEFDEFAAGSFLENAPEVAVSSTTGAGHSASCGRRSKQAPRGTGEKRRGMVSSADRSRLHDEGLRHGGYRHAGFGHAAARTGGRTLSHRPAACGCADCRSTAKRPNVRAPANARPSIWPISSRSEIERGMVLSEAGRVHPGATSSIAG